jgi:hypothetical protein
MNDLISVSSFAYVVDGVPVIVNPEGFGVCVPVGVGDGVGELVGTGECDGATLGAAEGDDDAFGVADADAVGSELETGCGVRRTLGELQPAKSASETEIAQRASERAPKRHSTRKDIRTSTLRKTA